MILEVKGIKYLVSEYSERADIFCGLSFYNSHINKNIVINVDKPYGELLSASDIFSVLDKIQDLGFEEFRKSQIEEQ